MDAVGTATVQATRLDDWADGADIRQIDMIKLDLQGHELAALQGSTRLLSTSVKLVYSEVEFVQLYEECCTFVEVTTCLREFGFSLFQLYDLHEGPKVTESGQIIYGDAIYVNWPRVGKYPFPR
jgi:hypothetical protein